MKKSGIFLLMMILSGCGIYNKDISGNYTILPIEEETKIDSSWNYNNIMIIDNFFARRETPNGFKDRYYLGNKINLMEDTALYLNIKNNYSYHEKAKGYWPLLPLFPYSFTKKEYYECLKKPPVPIEITINKELTEPGKIIVSDFYINLKNGIRVNPIMVHNKIRKTSFPIDIEKAMNAARYPKPNSFEFPLYCNEINNSEIVMETTVNGKKYTSRNKIRYMEDITTKRDIVFFYAVSCALSGNC